MTDDQGFDFIVEEEELVINLPRAKVLIDALNLEKTHLEVRQPAISAADDGRHDDLIETDQEKLQIIGELLTWLEFAKKEMEEAEDVQ